MGVAAGESQVDRSADRETVHLAGLIGDVEKTGFVVSDELKSMAYLISDWESSSRYNDDFSVSVTDLNRALQLYEELESQILTSLKTHLGETQT